MHATWSRLVVINLPFGSGLILIKLSSYAQQAKCLFLLWFLSQGHFVELYGFPEKLLYQFFPLQLYTEAGSLAVDLN